MIGRSIAASALCLISTMTSGAGFDPLDFKNNFGKTPQEEQTCQRLIYQGRDTSNKDNWMHMHHFCDCIRFTNRAYAVLSTPYAVKYNLELAIGGCDYVLARATPDFSMLPEIHLQKGKAFKLWKKDGPAAAEFIEALKGNPKLAPAYTALSDLEADRGNKKDALRIVTEGLRHVPESVPLQRRYKELGGQLPYPGSSATSVAPPTAQPNASGGQTKATGTSVPQAGMPEKPKAETTTDLPALPVAGAPAKP